MGAGGVEPMRIEEGDLTRHEQLDELNFGGDTGALVWSYALRSVGGVLFFFVFAQVARVVHPELPWIASAFVEIGIPGVPGWVSILLVVVDVIVVISFHELIHAAVFFFTEGAPPRIGVRGLIVYAEAPDYLSRRHAMIVNALAPFTVITALGVTLIAALPVTALPWVLIATVVNAAAAAGDFMTVRFIVRQPRDALFHDTGDATTAYRPPSDTM
jgi:hypothetical protein